MAGTFGQINSAITIPALQSVRRNVGDDGFEAFTPGTPGGAVWGEISGVISVQTNLYNILNELKQYSYLME